MPASGFTPISLYYSSTGAAVPSAGNLVAGELALNTNDGKLYYKNSSGVVTLLAGATSGPAGGSTTQVQYNNAGVLAGITGATTNGTALTLTAPVLGTPASGTVTNLTGTASININGTVGATTPTTGAFTSGTFSTTLGVTGVATFTAAGGIVLNRTNANTALIWQNNTVEKLRITNRGDASDAIQFSVANATVDALTFTQAGAVSIPGTLAAGATTVTGTLSASGKATLNSTAGGSQSSNKLNFTSAAANPDGIYMGNTTGTMVVGIEGSSGGQLGVGTSAYASVVGTIGATALQLIAVNNVIATVSSTGLAVTGTLSASGATTLATTLVVTAASNSLGVVINGRSSDNLGAMYFYANNGTTNYATITTSATEFRHSAVPAASVQTFYTNASERMRIDASGNVLVTNPAGLGYGTGAGGSVTQATSKATAVTLNKPCGTITLAADALASNTTARFSFNNSILAITDTVILTIRNGVTAGAYLVWVDGTAAGSCTLAIRNISGGSLSDAVVLNFSIIKGVTA